MRRRRGLLYADKTIISEKIKEAFNSVLPITAIVLFLTFTLVPVDSVMGIRSLENI